MTYTVYLAGEIHTDWREELANGVQSLKLPVEFLGPVTNHQLSDDCGELVAGSEEKKIWKDRKGAGLNGVRTSSMISRCDLAIVKFGEKYRQWNAAFDAGMVHAMGKPFILIRPEELIHPLKEVERAAHIAVEDVTSALRALEYVVSGEISDQPA